MAFMLSCVAGGCSSKIESSLYSHWHIAFAFFIELTACSLVQQKALHHCIAALHLPQLVLLLCWPLSPALVAASYRHFDCELCYLSIEELN